MEVGVRLREVVELGVEGGVLEGVPEAEREVVGETEGVPVEERVPVGVEVRVLVEDTVGQGAPQLPQLREEELNTVATPWNFTLTLNCVHRRVMGRPLPCHTLSTEVAAEVQSVPGSNHLRSSWSLSPSLKTW